MVGHFRVAEKAISSAPVAMMKVLTLAHVVVGKRILLGYKKRGFGCGRWNGFGGKLEPGETVEQAAKRETLEECGLEVKNLKQVGRMIFRFADNFCEPLDVRVFLVTEFQGQPRETEEMRPEWYEFSDIPYDKMWPDDYLWVPMMLEGSHFEGEFNFRGMDIVESYTLNKVPSILQ